VERFTVPDDGMVRATRVGAATAAALDLAVALERARPSWHADAFCRRPEYADVTWFPERGQDSRPAVAVCTECTVRPACAAWAMAQDPRTLLGIWGGMSARERQRRAGTRSEPADAA
jgi:hypothetical protein